MILVKIKENISTINILLIFIGFPLFTTLFLPNEYNSGLMTRAVTVPVRAFSLSVSIFVLLSGARKNIYISPHVQLTILYLLLYIAYLFVYITVLATTVAAQFDNKNDYYLYAVGTVLLPVLSVIYGYNKINSDLFYWAAYLSLAVIATISIFTNHTIDGQLDIRNQGNVALNTIGYGQLGASLVLMSFYKIYYSNKKKYLVVPNILLLFVGIFVVLKSGSKSPIFSMIFALSVFLCSQGGSRLKNVLIMIIMCVCGYMLSDLIVGYIEYLSPVMFNRMNDLVSGDLDLRDVLFQDAWKQFIDSPVLGNDFVLTSGFGVGWYPHNIILESFMSMGILGGSIIIALIVLSIKKSIKVIGYKDKNMIFALLYLQYLMLHMVSGSIYNGGILFVFMVVVLMNKNYGDKIRRQYL
jgi:O-antigen ligase